MVSLKSRPIARRLIDSSFVKTGRSVPSFVEPATLPSRRPDRLAVSPASLHETLQTKQEVEYEKQRGTECASGAFSSSSTTALAES